MMKFQNILRSKIQEHEIDFVISSLIQKSYDIKPEDMWTDSVDYPFFPHSVFSSQSAGSVDLAGIVLPSHRATLHDFMALSYGPVRALA
jgi:hypothetical protein